MYVPTLSAWTRGRDTESIEWFIEGQAFSPSYDAVSSTGDTHENWERETSCWKKGGGGRRAESYDTRERGEGDHKERGGRK
jgi:hypothetical protein